MTNRLCAALLALPVALALAFAGGAGAFGNPGKKDPDPAPAKPEVRLSVSPRHGFRPLTVTLTGTLEGVDPSDQQFCHAGVEWESRTPVGVVSVSKEDPKCLHPPEEVHVQFTYTKVVTLSRVGSFTYRLIIHKRDGGRLLSNTQEIRVLDNQ